MDINELNKMSVTALFSKLTSQFNFGSGKDFAGMLSGARAADLLPENANAVSREKPVENKASKPRSVDLPADKTRDVPSAVREKTEKTEKLNEERPVSDKKSPDVSESDADNRKVDDSQVEGVVAVVQPATPVVDTLTPAAEAAEVNSFEGTVAVGGIVADNAVVEGVDVAGQEAEVLPDGGVTFLGDEKAGVWAPASNEVPQISAGQESAAPLNGVAVKGGAVDAVSASASASADLAVKTVPADVAEPVDAEADPVVADKNVKANVAGESAAVVQDKSFEKTTFVEKENVLPDAVAEAPANDAADVEVRDVFEVKAAGHQITEAEDFDVDKNVKQISADNDAEIQAARLEEMLGGEQLKVSVDVKEEKIAYHSNQGLIKDRLALEEAVAELENAEGGVLSENMESLNVPSAQVKTPANVQQPIAAPQQTAAVDEASVKGSAEVSKVGAVSGNGNAGHAAAAGGAEYANAAKNEANAKANETSFRDVFKGMAKEAVEQVKVNITKSAVKGIDSINVRLKPEELGHIEIKMQIKDGKLQAQIISSRPETMEALQKEAQILEKAFNDAGFQTDENSLNFSCRNDGQQAGQNQGRENPRRDFIGEVFETEANGELLVADAANQNWSAEKGLNIKV